MDAPTRLHSAMPPTSPPHGVKRSAEAIDALPPSSAAKLRKTNATRTGQACDRCKARKIRCDARPGGCSPCLQNNTECKTTDRVTGRTTSRGHTETLEYENNSLKVYVMELQSQLKQQGIEPTAPPVDPHYMQPTPVYGGQWDASQSNGYQHEEQQASMGALLPEFRAGSIGDNYLGVASENIWLSPIEGTSLALFGTKIDLADFMPPEPSREAIAMSYHTFWSHAFGKTQSTHAPDLPSYEQCRQYAEWYFRSIQTFTPILSKPHFMQMLTQIYHEARQPTPAETVMIHMVLAIMYFQYSARNESEQTRQMSFEHYHYALTFIPQLMMNHKLEDIQALALICSQLRNQPRPGASWHFTNSVLGLAIESGLHRSAKAWPSPNSELDPHTVEMRKRVFWSILLFHINCSGNFGRPQPLRFEDFDIEIPEPIADNLPQETGLTPWKKCSFRAGLEGFKLLKILSRIYSTIYAVNRSSSGGPYDMSVRQLEKDLQTFQDQLPPELSGGAQTVQEDRISALFLQLSINECQLLLHHPSLCRSNSPQVYAQNLDVCLDAGNGMMVAASKLKQLKSLDTTLYYATDFLAAICTTIFAYTERKAQLESEDLRKLRADMDTWLDVLGPVGQMLGTGLKLQQFMGTIVDRHLDELSRHLAAQTASAAVSASANSSTTVTAQQHHETAPAYEQQSVVAKYEQPPSEYYTTPYGASYAAVPQAPNASAQQPLPQQQQQQVAMMPNNVVPSFDPTAWRHFAENMMSGATVSEVPVAVQANSEAFSMAAALSAATAAPVNRAVVVNGGRVPQTTAFGGMAMPDSSQAWPMVQYSHLE
ncbi:hypothetical protein LTS02_002435 [Friedmanniomyces endolithicus]|nr:hypothetical protein LTR94_003917 [Friedmanniomyces endolithicus]KAK0806673.1 hypothetical protein LTR38_005158 [Friedmanniomyces endolithicus]KAK0814288.1 hypothetical protein LTR59_000825 [Friedmanniomyces endolithicus]KAK0818649.1 hypothetical protein LTR75_002563 [Friedmanniomyces endolithicus]KAK0870406.1 hypothetical protein LTS02_002435 [Friedmanniomyces endolithicus]